MIRLYKSAKPDILKRRGTAWTEAFSENTKLRHYAHKEVKDALRLESHQKCDYCEGRMEHVSSAHIEHILPKARFPELVCDWNNLILACQKCNRNKWDYYDEECSLLNPYKDDPTEHLVWYGPWVSHKSPDRGRVTITRLQLNRSDLLFERSQKLDRVKEIIEQIECSPPAVARALAEYLSRLRASDADFSAVVDSFIEQTLVATETSI